MENLAKGLAHLRKNLQHFMMAGAIGSIPFSTQANRYFIIGWAIAVAFNIRWPISVQNILSNRRIFLPGLVVLLNLIGLLYTSDTKNGFALLERSAITLAIPLLIAISPPKSTESRRLLYFFVYVCLLVIFYCVLYALWRTYETGGMINEEKVLDREYYYLFNNELTSSAMGISPIYLGLYLNFCIAFLLIEVFVTRNRNKRNILLLAALHVCQLLVFSLSAVVALLAIWILIAMKILVNERQHLLRVVTIATVTFVTLSVLAYKIKPLHDRIFVSFDYDFEQAHIGYWSGITLRLAVWECTWEAIEESPLIGFGTGDVEQTLNDHYKRKNFALGQMLELDSHNQYFESYLMHGIFGISSLFAILLLLCLRGFKENRWLLILFATMLCLGFLTEALLTTQKGIVFFSIFLPLLYLPAKDNEKDFDNYS